MSVITEIESVAEGAAVGVATGGPVGGALGAVEGAAKGISWKVWAGLAAAVVLALIAWRVHAFVAQAAADRAALVAVTGQRDTAIATANQNAAALVAAEKQHAAVVASATAAASAAQARAATLAQSLETLRHAPRSICTPSPVARSLLDRLRK